MGFHRIIDSVREAVARPEGPWGGRASRPRGAKALGVRYEKALAAALPDAKRGQWWEFVDSNGPGWCQTDLMVEGERSVLVLEAKYSWVMQGHTQLELLYRPVVELALGKPLLGVVVCKSLRAGMPPDVRVVGDLPSAVELARQRRRVVLHWLGSGPLFPAPRAQPLRPTRAYA